MNNAKNDCLRILYRCTRNRSSAIENNSVHFSTQPELFLWDTLGVFSGFSDKNNSGEAEKWGGVRRVRRRCAISDMVRADVADIPALAAAAAAAAAADNSWPIQAPAAEEWVREWAG